MFESEKKQALGRKDRSKKGCIDARIRSLVWLLNAKPGYYTTSSCSGRVMLLVPGITKRDTDWLFVSHEPVSLRQLQRALSGKLPKRDVWLRQEAMILHVCCKAIGDAKKLLQLSKDAGFRRSGIISLGKRIVVEIVGSSHFETIVANKGKPLLDDNVMRLLAAEANKRLGRNFAQIARFRKAFMES